MSLFRTAAKCRNLMRFTPQNQGLPALLRSSPRHFSTESEQPNQTSKDGGSSGAVRPPPNTGRVYGKLFGITKHTEKRDILNLLEGCKLSSDDIKVDYNRGYAPVGMVIQFPSRRAFDVAIRELVRKGRVYRLEMVADSKWNPNSSYDGKAVLLQGIPRMATEDDIEWFLSGCTYNSSQTRIFLRATGVAEPIKCAVVHFPSRTLAEHAFITKNGGFCRNNQVSVQVLH